MSELRQNMATKEWVIIASERAKRPEQFAEKLGSHRDLPEHDPNCPFCPGNESQTPPESFRATRGEHWHIRAFPNKFAAVSISEPLTRKSDGVHSTMTGYGMHEVIVESPRHNACLAMMPDQDVCEVILAYRHFYLEAADNPALAHVVIFENHGPEAGTSLEHPHSQVVALPVVPAEVRNRMESAMHYYDDHGTCAYCRMIQDELSDRERILEESKYFVAFVLFAALTPFHIWVVPRRHCSSFGDICDEEAADLAGVVRRILARVHVGLNNPDYNIAIRSVPLESPVLTYAHWYLSLTVRLTKAAGFELGSGMYINTSIPEQSAAFLRNMVLT